MYRVFMMLGLMGATAVMGLALTFVSIQEFGSPQDVVDAHEKAIERVEQAPTEPSSSQASDTEHAR